MSMIGCFYAVADADLEKIVQEPKLISRLWTGEVETPQVVQSKESFFSRIFGGKKQAGANSTSKAAGWRPIEKPEAFDLDKAWQGIHFLLTGSDWEGSGELAFILQGGKEIDEDCGYGPAHGFTAAEVKKIAAALGPIEADALFQKADPAKFTEQQIYPEIWDEPKEECMGYVVENFKALKKFMQGAAEKNRAVITYIG